MTDERAARLHASSGSGAHHKIMLVILQCNGFAHDSGSIGGIAHYHLM